MKAIVFERAGEPDQVLRLDDVSEPEPRAGEQLVRVTARPIHPADLSFIRGQYRIRPSFPQAAGLEGLGVVLGHGRAGRFAPGTRVAFRWPGSWAEVAAIPEHRLITVPDDVPDEMACQISLNPLTAWGLLDEAEVEPGEWLLMTAGASTVSNLVAAIARSRGIHTIGIVRGDAAQGAARSAAEHVFSAQDSQLLSRVGAATGDAAAALLDSVGGPFIPKLFPALKAGARIIAYGVQDREPAAVTNAMLIYGNLTWKGFGIDRWLMTRARGELSSALGSLWELIRRGALPLPVESIFALSAFREALAADARRGRQGKVLLT